ncbi:MAG: NAD(P)/FAD-dependent oxidoreductase, partial [Thermodesulfobacteriota bacterium]|nr:NAD(P)/FAD-dependent oxidoreductase [Thermodesulfobacteriota bacterium]
LGPVYKDLELAKHGSKYIFPEVMYALLFSDGESLIGYNKDLDRTCNEIAKFSKKDAQKYRELASYYMKFKDLFVGYLYNPPVPVTQMYEPLEKTDEGREMIRIFLADMQSILDENFESEEVKAWLGLHLTQAGHSHTSYGGAVLVPTMMVLAFIDGIGEAVGGSKTLADAMVRFIEAHGGTVKNNCHVSKLLIENGTASAVQLSDGTTINGKLFVSNVEVKQLMEDIVGNEHLPPEIKRQVERWKYDENSLFTVHLALNEPPRWEAKDPKIQEGFCVGFGVDTIDVLTSQYNDIRRGIPPKDIGPLSVMCSIADPTQAPPGKHTAFIWQYAPYRLANEKGIPTLEGAEKWDDIKDEYGEKCMDVWRKFAPNLTKDNILGQYNDSPLDFGRRSISLREGSMCSGALSPHQMGMFRPFHGYPPYRTPIENLYMCGPSTHPAGGCSGAPGYNAAGVIADDQKFKKWWK